MSTPLTIWQKIDDLLQIYDGTLKILAQSRYCWSAELRLTLTNPDNCPSLSVTFYKIGSSPLEVVHDTYSHAQMWIAASTMKPIPPVDPDEIDL